MKENLVQKLERVFLSKVDRVKIWKAARFIIGLLPLISSVMFVVHIMLLLQGYDYEIAYVICSYSFLGFLAWMIISFAFQYNYMHRACITYNYLVSFCTDFQREIGFGAWLEPARWFVLSIGVLIVTELIIEYAKKIMA